MVGRKTEDSHIIAINNVIYLVVSNKEEMLVWQRVCADTCISIFGFFGD